MYGLAVSVVVLGVAVAMAAAVWRVVSAYRLKARRAGYPTLGDYLRAAPRSDVERRDAVDLALRGLVLCVLGLVFPPFLLLGLFPLYYGARKVTYASMGLALVEDADPPSA